MTKKKVNLVYIESDSARLATFKKRRKGLMKKVKELSILCGIDACAILMSPFPGDSPEVYPPSSPDRNRILSRFGSMGRDDQSKKMLNHEAFLRHQISKLSDQLLKLRRENHAKKISGIFSAALAKADSDNDDDPCEVLRGLDVEDLEALRVLVDENIVEVRKRLEKVCGERSDHGNSININDNNNNNTNNTNNTNNEDHIEEVIVKEEHNDDQFRGVTWELPWFMEWTTNNPNHHDHGDH